MSDLRPKGVKIKLGGVEYSLLFSLNAIDEIQDHFDKSIVELNEIVSDERNRWINTSYILSVLINDSIDLKNETAKTPTPHIDEKFVSRRITSANYFDAVQKIYEAFTSSAPEGDEDDPMTSE